MVDSNNSNRFQRFVLDPKTSVKTYLADSLAPHEHGSTESNMNHQIPFQQSGNWQHPGPNGEVFQNQNTGSPFLQQANITRPTSAASNQPAYRPQSPPQCDQPQYNGEHNTYDISMRPQPQEPHQFGSNYPTTDYTSFAPPQHISLEQQLAHQQLYAREDMRYEHSSQQSSSPYAPRQVSQSQPLRNDVPPPPDPVNIV